MLVSVIVPIYDTPVKLFDRCLKSILNDTKRTQIEVIVINDGSDDTLSKEYTRIVEQNPNVIIYTQCNRGVSTARNNGIRMAKGNYIAFVDADDIVENNFIDTACTIAESTEADIITGIVDFRDWQIDEQLEDKIKNDTGYTKLKKDDALKNLLVGGYLNNNILISGSPCAKLYKRSLVSNNLFREKIRYSEDQIFNIEIFHKADTVIYVPNVWYRYCCNDFSAMNKYDGANYALVCQPFFDVIYEMITTHKYADIYDELGIFSLNIIYNIYYKIKSHNVFKEIKSISENLKKIDLVDFLCKRFKPTRYYSWKTRIKFFLLKYFLIKL